MEERRMKELSDAQFTKRSAVLIKQYAELVKAGLPADKLAKWNAKVDTLVPIQREVIREMVAMDPSLIGAIVGDPNFLSADGKENNPRPGAPSRGW
jgi:hypothetical protein